MIVLRSLAGDPVLKSFIGVSGTLTLSHRVYTFIRWQRRRLVRSVVSLHGMVWERDLLPLKLNLQPKHTISSIKPNIDEP